MTEEQQIDISSLKKEPDDEVPMQGSPLPPETELGEQKSLITPDLEMLFTHFDESYQVKIEKFLQDLSQTSEESFQEVMSVLSLRLFELITDSFTVDQKQALLSGGQSLANELFSAESSSLVNIVHEMKKLCDQLMLPPQE